MSRTEAGGSFMAEGYAKATGKLGVIMTTSGPGALNITTSLQNALSDGTQILALTGQVSTAVLGTDAFQEADIVGVTKPVTKWNYMIKDGTQINNAIDTAIKAAFSNRYGPTLIDLPKNVMGSQIKEEQQLTTHYKQEQALNATITTDDIIDLLENSTRPVILAGQGVIQGKAVEELRTLSKKYNIPTTTTLMGLGVFNEQDPLSLKMMGMHGSFYANKAVHNCDLLLNFGSRFDDRIIGDPKRFAPYAKIVHIDINKHNINKVIKTPYYINDNCLPVLQNLLKYTKPKIAQYDSWLLQIQEWKKTKFSFQENTPVLQGRHILATLNKILSTEHRQTIIVADVGAHQMWAAQFIDYDHNRIRFITSGGLGTMGYALPAAIGVKVGRPQTTVICICGDGGFTMSFVELITAIENKINIKVFIINNSYQLMVKIWQEKFYDNRITGVKMNNPPFHTVCEALGCKALLIQKGANLEEAVKEILGYEDGPIVANFITDDSESVLPMVKPGKPIDDMLLDDTPKLTGDAPC